MLKNVMLIFLPLFVFLGAVSSEATGYSSRQAVLSIEQQWMSLEEEHQSLAPALSPAVDLFEDDLDDDDCLSKDPLNLLSKFLLSSEHSFTSWPLGPVLDQHFPPPELI